MSTIPEIDITDTVISKNALEACKNDPKIIIAKHKPIMHQ